MGERERDTEWKEHVVTSVEPSGDDWMIGSEEGWSFWIKSKYGVRPKTGDVVRMYGRGFGHPVRGIDLNGRSLYYETEAEYRARAEREIEERNAAKKAEWEGRREEMDRRLASLPLPFQMRVCRFRKNNPDFGWEYESYEMASCVDAVKIAAALNDASEIETFHALPWEEQKKVVPGLDSGHSGNTFGMAVRLAHHFMTNPDYVWMDHAAIAPLVGCECGCQPVQDVEAERAEYEALARALACTAAPHEQPISDPGALELP